MTLFRFWIQTGSSEWPSSCPCRLRNFPRERLFTRWFVSSVWWVLEAFWFGHCQIEWVLLVFLSRKLPLQVSLHSNKIVYPKWARKKRSFMFQTSYYNILGAYVGSHVSSLFTRRAHVTRGAWASTVGGGISRGMKCSCTINPSAKPTSTCASEFIPFLNRSKTIIEFSGQWFPLCVTREVKTHLHRSPMRSDWNYFLMR